MKENKIKISNEEDFNIIETLECGQIFTYKKINENSYVVVNGQKYAVINYDENLTTIQSKDIDVFYNFFDFDNDYNKIKNEVKKINPEFSKYLNFSSGIRILKQDIYQTIISFIVSANNNIKRIKGILFRISKEFGNKLEDLKDIEMYSFPTIQQLKNATKQDFERLGAGYRSEYLVKSIQMLDTEEFSKENLLKLSTPNLKKKLLSLLGVGPKVADCILLFGFSRTDVFPVDTWIRKAYNLFETDNKSDEKISQYFVNIFKNYSGYAQQYLYNYMINN